MLTLSRNVGEAIFIDEDIVIHVIDISKGRVRLAIEAPRQVKILRAELIEDTNNKKASQ